jgi:hypothetical protein
MATIRERRPGVWEVRVFTGSDARGRPTQLSRTVHGGKREALRVAAELDVGPGRSSPAGRSVSDVLDVWVDQNVDTWAPSSARDQQSRVRSIKKDQISRVPLARLTVGDVERWHTRLRKAGMADAGIKNQHGVLRAALSQAMRWGWVSSNVASLARLRSTKVPQRTVMSVDDVRAVMTAAASIDAAAELAFRIAAVAGTRRAELASLRWTDEHDGQLLIDSAIEITERGDGAPELREGGNEDCQRAHRDARRRHGGDDRQASSSTRALRPVDVWPRPRAGQPRPHQLVVETSPPDVGHRPEVAPA